MLRGVTTGFRSDDEQLLVANRQYSAEFGFFETQPLTQKNETLLSKNGY